MKLTDKIEINNEDNMLLMARYPDNYFELAIVDPPYKQGKKGRVYTCVNKNLTKNTGYKQITLDHGNKTKVDLGDRPTSEYFNELFRVSKNQIIWGMQYFTNNLPPNQCCICWDKGYGDTSTFSQFELAWTSFETRTRIFRKYGAADRINAIHITQKPIKLYEWLLTNYANEGDKILDTHLGSGSHAIACHNLGFELTACELDPDYYNDSIKRFKEVTAQKDFFR